MPINRTTYHGSDIPSDDGKPDTASNDAVVAVGKKDLGPSTVTLSGLLNAIDGVSSQASAAILMRAPSDIFRKTLFFSPRRISPTSWTKLFDDQVDSTFISLSTML
jgi:hypothetical protein